MIGNNTCFKLLDVYLMGDQPTSCGLCGARTYFHELRDDKQIHECLDCKYIFLVEYDHEFYQE